MTPLVNKGLDLSLEMTCWLLKMRLETKKKIEEITRLTLNFDGSKNKTTRILPYLDKGRTTIQNI